MYNNYTVYERQNQELAISSEHFNRFKQEFLPAIWPENHGFPYFCRFQPSMSALWADNWMDIQLDDLWLDSDVYFGIATATTQGTEKQRVSLRGPIFPHTIGCFFADFDAADYDSAINEAKKAGQQIDITKAKAKAWKALCDAQNRTFEASMIVDTGGGFQAFWLINEPILITQANMGEISDLMAGLCGIWGGDSAVKDLARVLRIPGTYNHKPHYLGGPFLAEIVKLDVTTTYSLEQFQELAEIRKQAKQMPLDQVAKNATGTGKPMPANTTQAGRSKLEQLKAELAKDKDWTYELSVAAQCFDSLDATRNDNKWYRIVLAYAGSFAHTPVEEQAFNLLDEWSKGSTRYEEPKEGGHAYLVRRWGEIKERQEYKTNNATIASVIKLARAQDPDYDAKLKARLQARKADPLKAAIENAPSAEELTDQLPDLVDFALDLKAKELMKICRLLKKKGVKGGDITEWKNAIKETKKERQKERTKSQGPIEIRGRLVEQNHDIMAELFDLGYDFAMNECNDNIVVQTIKGVTSLDDPLMSKIRGQMRDLGHKAAGLEDAYIAYAYDNSFHPIKDYLNSLEWDGTNHILHLANHLVGKTLPDTEHLFDSLADRRFINEDGLDYTWEHAILRRWLVGSVAKVFTAQPNMMLVLEGAQGSGKSYFCEWLASPRSDYFIEMGINPEDKDHLVRLADKWIWEVQELGATTRKRDREALKAFITQKKIDLRKAYARKEIKKPAMASLIGTINNESGFLSDPTGNRRFMILPLDRIEWGYTRAVNINQVWAHAMHLWREHGETGLLTKAEKRIQEAINAQFQTTSAAGDLFEDLYEITHDPKDKAPVTEIAKVLKADGYQGNSATLKREIDRIMSLNNIKKSGRGARFYGKKKTCYIGIKYKAPRCTSCGIPALISMGMAVNLCYSCKHKRLK